MNQSGKMILFFSLACAASVGIVHAFDYTWTAGNSAYETPGNWDPSGPPDSDSVTAAIQNGGTANLASAKTVLSLTLGGPGSGAINLNAAGNLTAGQLIQGAGASLGTVNFDGGALTVLADSADLLSGTTNTIADGGATLNTQGYNATISTAIANSSGAAGGLTKTGSGILTLTGANAYTGPTTIGAGALQANDGTGLPAGSLLKLDGGVLQCDSALIPFTRNLGATGGMFQWTTNGGGFSNGSSGEWQINIGGNTPYDTLTWGNNVGSQIVGTLKLCSPSSQSYVTLVNNIDLNGEDRTFEVNNPDTGMAYRGGITSVISNSAGTSAGIMKTGPGRLYLTGTNTYDGTTTCNEGFLAYATAKIPSNPDGLQPYGRYVVNGGTLCFCGRKPRIKGFKITGGEAEGLNTTVLYCDTDYDIQGGRVYGLELSNGKDAVGNPIVVGLTKTGNTLATLEFPATYTGTTTISAGTLALVRKDETYTGQISTASLIVNNATFLIDDDLLPHAVGTITTTTGTGTTQLNAGSQLTAASITQGTVIIGVGAKLTIAPVGAAGATSGGSAGSPVPEPSALLLLAAAGFGILLVRRRHAI